MQHTQNQAPITAVRHGEKLIQNRVLLPREALIQSVPTAISKNVRRSLEVEVLEDPVQPHAHWHGGQDQPGPAQYAAPEGGRTYNAAALSSRPLAIQAAGMSVQFASVLTRDSVLDQGPAGSHVEWSF